MKNNSLFMTNPIIRKVAKCEDVEAQEHVTYKGIAAKVVFFLMFSIVGIVLFSILKNVGTPSGISDFTIQKTIEVSVKNVSITALIVLAVFVLLFILSPILTAIFKFAVPLSGMLYCTSTGYIISFTASAAHEFRTAVYIAFFLTIALFCALALIYSTGKIKVTQKFKSAFLGILLASLIFSIILFILNFIPALRFIPEFFKGNSIFGIVFSLIGLIIAVIFVIVDFSVIQNAVDNKIPKSNEWFCAYALAFSFIYLYFKILDIVIKLIARNKSK